MDFGEKGSDEWTDGDSDICGVRLDPVAVFPKTIATALFREHLARHLFLYACSHISDFVWYPRHFGEIEVPEIYRHIFLADISRSCLCSKHSFRAFAPFLPAKHQLGCSGLCSHACHQHWLRLADDQVEMAE